MLYIHNKNLLLPIFKITWSFQQIILYFLVQGDGEFEAYYLTLSGHYAEAHKVIIDQLAPTTILNGIYFFIFPLFTISKIILTSFFIHICRKSRSFTPTFKTTRICRRCWSNSELEYRWTFVARVSWYLRRSMLFI